MLSYLSQYEDVFGPLRLLRAVTFRTLMAAGTASVIGFLIGPGSSRSSARSSSASTTTTTAPATSRNGSTRKTRRPWVAC